MLESFGMWVNKWAYLVVIGHTFAHISEKGVQSWSHNFGILWAAWESVNVLYIRVVALQDLKHLHGTYLKKEKRRLEITGTNFTGHSWMKKKIKFLKKCGFYDLLETPASGPQGCTCLLPPSKPGKLWNLTQICHVFVPLEKMLSVKSAFVKKSRQKMRI